MKWMDYFKLNFSPHFKQKLNIGCSISTFCLQEWYQFFAQHGETQQTMKFPKCETITSEWVDKM